ncbi:Ku protein [Bacillota bacterium Meth-B3]
MAVAHKTTIAFSLVSIPVSMYTATQDNDIHFNQLHDADGQRIRYKKICGHCGTEVESKDIVKGYEYGKDKYVTITDEDIENAKSAKDKTISILHFANLNQISPVYYEKSYQVVPEAGGEKAFELLRSALMAQQKIAIGKTVMGSRDTLMAIIPREEGMLIQTMFFADEIKDLPKTYNKPEVSEQELNMARMLIDSMDAPFIPDAYHDEYQMKLRAMIEAKIQGRDIAQAAPEPGTVIDLMDALKASIEKQQSQDEIRKNSPVYAGTR